MNFQMKDHWYVIIRWGVLLHHDSFLPSFVQTSDYGRQAQMFLMIICLHNVKQQSWQGHDSKCSVVLSLALERPSSSLLILFSIMLFLLYSLISARLPSRKLTKNTLACKLYTHRTEQLINDHRRSYRGEGYEGNHYVAACLYIIIIVFAT